MKRKFIALSRQYETVLRKHLKDGPRASLQPARGLGRQAVRLGLETLDVARIHEEVLAIAESGSERNGVIGRAEIFFSEAITPVEETHHAALKASCHLSQLNKTLGRRAVDLAAINRSLKRNIARRRIAEKAQEKSAAHSARLLQESRNLQKLSQYLTRKTLSAQENKRKKISCDLQDEIARLLVGINVRLLTLKQMNALGIRGLKKEIASVQRLVDISGRIIDRFVRELPS